jgi:hypothetical protein
VLLNRAERGHAVKKHIDKWSYWLGVGSATIALVMRTFNAFGIWIPMHVVQGITIWYMSFYKAALLFLLVNIATSIRIYLRMLAVQHEGELTMSHSTGVGSTSAKLRAAAMGA